MLWVSGRVRVGSRTKELVKRIKTNEIAFIDHQDLDEVAAQALISAGAKAVINASPSISGKYPNLGPLALANAGIPLLDGVGKEAMSLLQDGEEIFIKSDQLFRGQKKLASGQLLNKIIILNKMEQANKNYHLELERFVRNTISFALKEVDVILRGLRAPPLGVDLRGKHVLVVVRGQGYRKDLQAIRTYIREKHPVLVGVDGGADALLDFGYRPDLIVGDMDSVSDRALLSGAQLIVHAYPSGEAPGAKRLTNLGLKATLLPAPGTSEDVALLLAYEKGAELIVAVGTHSSVIDFLEKGRDGMASTVLARMKIGSILVDARGVSKLYEPRLKPRYLLEIFLASLIPLVAVFMISPFTYQIIRLLLIKVRFYLTLL